MLEPPDSPVRLTQKINHYKGLRSHLVQPLRQSMTSCDHSSSVNPRRFIPEGGSYLLFFLMWVSLNQTIKDLSRTKSNSSCLTFLDISLLLSLEISALLGSGAYTIGSPSYEIFGFKLKLYTIDSPEPPAC